MEKELTDEQIETWRKTLSLFLGLGPFAKFLTKQKIQKFRDNMQRNIEQDTSHFISKTLSDITGDKRIEPQKLKKQEIENQTTFGDLLKEAKKSKTHKSQTL